MFFRAFYAIPQTMRGPGGHMVNAVRGTLDTLARYVTDRKPRHLAFTTDEDWRPEWRGGLGPGAKQERAAPPSPPAPPPPEPSLPAPPVAAGGGGGGVGGDEEEGNAAALSAPGGR